MAVTFTTDQQVFDAYTLRGDVTVGLTTRPSSTSIALFRSMAYSKIYKIIATATDSNDVAFTIEMALVFRMLDNRMKGTNQYEGLMPDEEDRLMFEFNDLPCGPTEPNKDSALTR